MPRLLNSEILDLNSIVKKSTKAALLSALVFPGIGHIYLKKTIRGAILASASFSALYYLVSSALEKAFEISEKIQQGEIALDVEAITRLVSEQSTNADGQLLNIASYTLVICWLIGIFDAYRIASGKK